MTRHARLVALLGLCVVLLAGCTATPADDASEADAGAAGGGMGGGMGGGEGSGEGGMVVGAIASARNAALEVDAVREGTASIALPRVLAPTDGWVVARSSLPPGRVLGWARVARGENADVALKLSRADGAPVLVALHADRGVRGTFEFDPDRPLRSLDKPIIVEGRPVEERLAIAGLGAEVFPHEVSLWVEDQPGADGSLRVRQALAPTPSWLVVNLSEDGFPGKRIALFPVGGELFEFEVPLSETPATDEVIVTLLADTGQQGTFEYRFDDPLGAPDQPYRVGQTTVSDTVRVR